MTNTQSTRLGRLRPTARNESKTRGECLDNAHDSFFYINSALRPITAEGS